MAKILYFLITDPSEKLRGIRKSIFIEMNVIESKLNWNWIEVELQCLELKLILKRRESNWFEIDMKLNCIRIELFWIDVAIEIDLNWIDLQLSWLETDWNWIDLDWIELNWIDYGLNWIDLNLNCIEWNWVEMCWIESKLNWADLNWFERAWHWINSIELEVHSFTDFQWKNKIFFCKDWCMLICTKRSSVLPALLSRCSNQPYPTHFSFN